MVFKWMLNFCNVTAPCSTAVVKNHQKNSQAIKLSPSEMQGLDEFCTGSYLLFTAAVQNQLSWSPAIHHRTFPVVFSSYVAKGVIGFTFAMVLVGALLLIYGSIRFVIPKSRWKRLLLKVKASNASDIDNSPVMTLIYLCIGFLSFGIPLRLLVTFPFLALLYFLGIKGLKLLLLRRSQSRTVVNS